MSDKNSGRVVAGALLLVAGGVIGAGAALLFAPQSGARTRRDLIRYGKKVRKKAAGVVDEFSASVTDMVDSVGDKAEDILEKGTDLAYETKQELLKALDAGQAKLEKQKAKLAKLIG